MTLHARRVHCVSAQHGRVIEACVAHVLSYLNRSRYCSAKNDDKYRADKCLNYATMKNECVIIMYAFFCNLKGSVFGRLFFSSFTALQQVTPIHAQLRVS